MDTMFVCHFIDPDLVGVEILFDKRRHQNKGRVAFERGVEAPAAHLYRG